MVFGRPVVSVPSIRAIFLFFVSFIFVYLMEWGDCSRATILYPSFLTFVITCVTDLLYSQGTKNSAPSAALCISGLARPNLSCGVGVMPHRYIFSTPTASAVLKIEPTLCALRMLCAITTMCGTIPFWGIARNSICFPTLFWCTLAYMFSHLKKTDSALWRLVHREARRQKDSIDLIASENEAPEGVLELLGSVLTNKYSEGYPAKRYYPGNEIIDSIELLAHKRARALFGLSERWHVNAQAYSGAIANLAVYLGLLEKGDTILSLSLDAGGHLSHGAKVSFVSTLFTIVHYGVDARYVIDYGGLERAIQKHKPKLVIAGASAYPRAIDFARIARYAHARGAFVLADISHYAGLISAGVYPSPFDHADVVMTTTHKSLFGPRAALIFCDTQSALARRKKISIGHAIDKAVFPGLQGGPHNNTIAAIAHGLSLSKKSKGYFKRVLANALSLCAACTREGFTVVGRTTDSHLMLLDMRPLGMDGAAAEKLLERAGILANRNTIAGDLRALFPSAIRVGTYAVTARGMRERDMNMVARFLGDILIRRLSPERVRKDVLRFLSRFSV